MTFLWRAAGSLKMSGGIPFTDVQSGSYYYDAVLWAVANGITTGTSVTSFSPDTACTCGQTMTFLYRYEKSPSVSGSSPFTDVAADTYYSNAVQWAVPGGHHRWDQRHHLQPQCDLHPRADRHLPLSGYGRVRREYRQ